MSAIEWSIESLRAFPETLRAFGDGAARCP
jgi:hypothetical protein